MKKLLAFQVRACLHRKSSLVVDKKKNKKKLKKKYSWRYYIFSQITLIKEI